MNKPIIYASLLLASSMAHAGNPPKLEPFVLLQAQSNIFKGLPFGAPEDGVEPSNDYLAGGVTLRWTKIEMDFSHGWAGVDCGHFTVSNCIVEQRTQISMRIYFLRKK